MGLAWPRPHTFPYAEAYCHEPERTTLYAPFGGPFGSARGLDLCSFFINCFALQNRWTYSTSTGFSRLPTAGQTLCWEIALFCRLPRCCRRHSGPFAGNPHHPLEIQKISWKIKFPAEVLFFQRKICFSGWKNFFPARKFIFQRIFQISG